MKSITDPMGLEDLPVLIEELDLSTPLGDLAAPPSSDGRSYKHVRILVRLRGLPIGYALVSNTRLSAHELAIQLWQQLGPAINEGLRALGSNEIDSLSTDGVSVAETSDELDEPFISVIICTRDRPEGALRTLTSVAALEYSNFEVILVDNAPSDERTHETVTSNFSGDPRVRYAREPRPGLSCARNRGLSEAKSDLVAYTDDDVNVDSLWLRGLARGFSRAERVGCVTGLVPSAELETPSQLYFDQRYSWGTQCRPRVFDLEANRDRSPLYPYLAGTFGTGANFAVDRRLIADLGGFDEALGAGTPSGGGEDLDMFVRTVLAGHRLVYEPSAIVTHVHRAHVSDLDRQLFNYGAGLTAYLTKQMSSPRRALDMLLRIPRGALHMRRSMAMAQATKVLPGSATRSELLGMMIGPWRYFQGSIRRRR